MSRRGPSERAIQRALDRGREAAITRQENEQARRWIVAKAKQKRKKASAVDVRGAKDRVAELFATIGEAVALVEAHEAREQSVNSATTERLRGRFKDSEAV